jgi:hypothetical protein
MMKPIFEAQNHYVSCFSIQMPFCDDEKYLQNRFFTTSGRIALVPPPAEFAPTNQMINPCQIPTLPK